MLLLGVRFFFAHRDCLMLYENWIRHFEISHTCAQHTYEHNNVTIWSTYKKLYHSTLVAMYDITVKKRYESDVVYPQLCHEFTNGHIETLDTYGMSNMIGNIKLMTLVCQFKRVLCFQFSRLVTSLDKRSINVKWKEWFENQMIEPISTELIKAAARAG